MNKKIFCVIIISMILLILMPMNPMGENIKDLFEDNLTYASWSNPLISYTLGPDDDDDDTFCGDGICNGAETFESCPLDCDPDDDDDDDTFCGDGICNGAETFESCPLDCPPPDDDPTNIKPKATIDNIYPNPAQEYEPVTFTGHGNDSDGTIEDYLWEINETMISKEPTFILDNLTAGLHTIAFCVMDNKDKWSDPITNNLTVIENMPPEVPVLTGEKESSIEEPYNLSVTALDPNDNQVYIMIDWDDNSEILWIGPYFSDIQHNFTHTFDEKGDYSIRVKAKDIYDLESGWATLEVSMPKQKIFNEIPRILLWLFERFPFLQPYFLHLL